MKKNGLDDSILSVRSDDLRGKTLKKNINYFRLADVRERWYVWQVVCLLVVSLVSGAHQS